MNELDAKNDSKQAISKTDRSALDKLISRREARQNLPSLIKYLVILSPDRQQMMKLENLDQASTKEEKVLTEIKKTSNAFLDLDYGQGTFRPLYSKQANCKWMSFVNDLNWSLYILFPLAIQQAPVEQLLRQINWFVVKLFNDYYIDFDNDPKLDLCLREFLKIITRQNRQGHLVDELKIYNYVTKKYKFKLLNFIPQGQPEVDQKNVIHDGEISVNDFLKNEVKAEKKEKVEPQKDEEIEDYSFGKVKVSKKILKLFFKFIIFGTILIGFLALSFSLRTSGDMPVGESSESRNPITSKILQIGNQIGKIFSFVDQEFFNMKIIYLKPKKVLPVVTKRLRLHQPHKSPDMRELLKSVPNSIVMDSAGTKKHILSFHFNRHKVDDSEHKLV